LIININNNNNQSYSLSLSSENMVEPTSQNMEDGASRQSGNRGSNHSGSTSVFSKNTSGQKPKRSAQEVTDRKKIKVLKQALKDERNQKQSL